MGPDEQPDPTALEALVEAYAGTRRRRVPIKARALILRYLLRCKVRTPVEARILGLDDAAPPPSRRFRRGTTDDLEAPSMNRIVCNAAGCVALATTPGGYCPAHRRDPSPLHLEDTIAAIQQRQRAVQDALLSMEAGLTLCRERFDEIEGLLTELRETRSA